MRLSAANPANMTGYTRAFELLAGAVAIIKRAGRCLPVAEARLPSAFAALAACCYPADNL